MYWILIDLRKDSTDWYAIHLSGLGNPCVTSTVYNDLKFAVKFTNLIQNSLVEQCYLFINFFCVCAAADRGFPVGGGGANSRGGSVSKNLYVKTKESGPLGGCAPAAPPWIRHWCVFENCNIYAFVDVYSHFLFFSTVFNWNVPHSTIKTLLNCSLVLKIVRKFHLLMLSLTLTLKPISLVWKISIIPMFKVKITDCIKIPISTNGLY